MASWTQVFLFSLCTIFAECTVPHLHHGRHHGLHRGMLYGSPYLYPGLGMGMGMHHRGPMMYGFKEEIESGNTEDVEKMTPEKTENSNSEIIPFEEQNPKIFKMYSSESSAGLLSFKDDAKLKTKSDEPNTEIFSHLVKREVKKGEYKDSMDSDSELPIIFPNEDIQGTPETSEEAIENAETESVHEDTSSKNEKEILQLAKNSDYLITPVFQASSPVSCNAYANQRDIQTTLPANSQKINQGLDRHDTVTNLNNYQNNMQKQVPMYLIQTPNNVNGVSQNNNQVPVNNIGYAPGVLTFLTIPNNIGLQPGNLPSNQYYVNTVPLVNQAGYQNTPLYNLIPMNQLQHNSIGVLDQPNNQKVNGIPINNQLVSVLPINNQANNVVPISGNNVPANSYVLLNSPQNVGPFPNQAVLNAWNVPVGNQPLNYNEQPINYKQQPNVVMLNGKPNNLQSTSTPNNALPQVSTASNGNLPVTGQSQPLYDNSQYIPVYNTRDKVDDRK